MPGFNFNLCEQRVTDADQLLLDNAGPSYSAPQGQPAYNNNTSPSYSAPQDQLAYNDGQSYGGADSQSQDPSFYDDMGPSHDHNLSFSDHPPYDFNLDFEYEDEDLDTGAGPSDAGPSGSGGHSSQTNSDNTDTARPMPRSRAIELGYDADLLRRNTLFRGCPHGAQRERRKNECRDARCLEHCTSYHNPSLNAMNRLRWYSHLPQQHPIITLSKEEITEAVKKGKLLIIWELFSKNALGLTSKQRRSLTERAINKSICACHDPNAPFTRFINKSHLRKVVNMFSSTHGKMILFARCFSHHESEHTHSRCRPIAFHAQVWLWNGCVTIHAKFQNPFIMALVIQFIWSRGRQSFLGLSPIKALKHIIVLSGAATYCALEEQGREKFEVTSFSEMLHGPKFKEILSTFKGLSNKEKADLKLYWQYILDIGPSQARHGEVALVSESSDLF
ncbi:hypothetical protein DEU56DRAFT_919607 [Suillus clintonianus]|uniref:uncharacterized protein n=1 Tax=Suillus clintonianus TaxID=1904413 RepID=UPI001B860881|nr:uncharacterized protein DEU56DRAFT_919607 [Suillus clintonianus]KAG2114398.1 hypothetical protein DEU56DRAFT_919607 [Suillus clintonianus]